MPTPRPADRAGIAAAVDALASGRLVVHPTETVVSLSGDPRDERAVAAARAIKGYAAPRPFLCLVPDPESARTLAADWPPVAERLAAAFWPGPLTLVVTASADAPPGVAAEGTIAVRPAVDPVSTALLSAWGGALFSTSANPRGSPPPVDVKRALSGLRDAPGSAAIAVALGPVGGAPAPAALPSTIVDAASRPPRLVRVGAIPEARIRALIPELEAPDDRLRLPLRSVNFERVNASRPYHLLVVCTGNTCRSPMAEAILRARFADLGVEAEVRSAGTYAVVGGPAQPNAVAAAARASLDLSAHVARQLDDELVRWADTVLCMSPSHARAVRSIDSAADVRLVADFASRPYRGSEIPDPMGRPEVVYHEVFVELEECLAAFATRHAKSPAKLGPGDAG